MAYEGDGVNIKPVYGDDGFTPPAELSLAVIRKIHNQLLIPDEEAIHSLTREVLMWRGEKDPDSI